MAVVRGIYTREKTKRDLTVVARKASRPHGPAGPFHTRLPHIPMISAGRCLQSRHRSAASPPIQSMLASRRSRRLLPRCHLGRPSQRSAHAGDHRPKCRQGTVKNARCRRHICSGRLHLQLPWQRDQTLRMSCAVLTCAKTCEDIIGN
jgi:hypothetical protein